MVVEAAVSEFVDANIFIRMLTGDDPVKQARCHALFERAARGEVRLATSEVIIAEVVYVLSSRVTYRQTRAAIAQVLRPVLEVKALKLDHKRAVLAALDLYEQSNLDFEDCLAVAHTRRLQLRGIYSYDRGFDRIPGIRRLEP